MNRICGEHGERRGRMEEGRGDRVGGRDGRRRQGHGCCALLALCGKHAEDRVPALLEGAHTLSELLVFALAGGVRESGNDLWCWLLLLRAILAEFILELLVFLLKLGYTSVEDSKLGLAPVAAVLSGDAVAVRARLFAILCAQL